MQCSSIGTVPVQALLLSVICYFVIGAHGNERSSCLETFTPNGTTSAAAAVTGGKAIVTTTINITPFFAPCNTGWDIARETMTVLVPECNEIQTRDEPRLTSVRGAEGPPTTTRIECLHSPTPPPVCASCFKSLTMELIQITFISSR